MSTSSHFDTFWPSWILWHRRSDLNPEDSGPSQSIRSLVALAKAWTLHDCPAGRIPLQEYARISWNPVTRLQVASILHRIRRIWPGHAGVMPRILQVWWKRCKTTSQNMSKQLGLGFGLLSWPERRGSSAALVVPVGNTIYTAQTCGWISSLCLHRFLACCWARVFPSWSDTRCAFVCDTVMCCSCFILFPILLKFAAASPKAHGIAKEILATLV